MNKPTGNIGKTLTSAYFFSIVGNPDNLKTLAPHMMLWHVPPAINKDHLPDSLYCSIYIKEPLERAFTKIVQRGLTHLVHSCDGCYNNRAKRGNRLTKSLHAGGAAIDINASTNQFNKKGDMPAELVACFTEEGLHWGGYWTKPLDYMHFQLTLEEFIKQYTRIHSKPPAH
jgi:hypothetical protein